MISAVRNFFERQIKLAEQTMQRDFIDSTFVHNFTIRKKNVEKLILNAFDKLDSAPDVEQTKRAFNKYYNTVYKREKVEALIKQPQFFGNEFDIVVEKKSTLISIKLAAGAYVQKRKEIKKGNLTGKTLKQNALNAVMAELFYEIVGKIKKETNTKFKTPMHPGQRTHGMTGEFKGMPLKDATQTTIGTVSFSEGFDARAEDLVRKLALENPEEFGYAIDLVMTEYINPLRKKYTIADKQDFNTNSLSRDLIIQVEYGDAQHNAAMREFDLPGIKSAGEAQLKHLIDQVVKTANKNPDEILGLRGSKSFKEKAESQVLKKYIDGLFPHKTKADLRLKVNKRILAQAKSDSNKTNKIATIKTAQKIGTTKTTRGRGVQRKKQISNPATSEQMALSLKNLLDAALPQRVAEKMVSPRLQFRTGRFANSAQVTNVAIGPRGGTEIEYTYQKDPYQTFEPGGRLGSVDRDPQRIIGESIREIAQQIMGKKFIRTRRV